MRTSLLSSACLASLMFLIVGSVTAPDARGQATMGCEGGNCMGGPGGSEGGDFATGCEVDEFGNAAGDVEWTSATSFQMCSNRALKSRVGYRPGLKHCGLAAPNYPVPFATPRPTTPTYLWYPPMMPHNSLPHYSNAYSYRHAPGLARTNVLWYTPPLHYAFDKLHNLIELPR